VDVRAGRAWHSRDALAAVAHALAAQGKLVLERPGAPLAVAPLAVPALAAPAAAGRGGGDGGAAACGGQLLQLPEVAPGPAHLAQGPAHLAQGPAALAQGPAHLVQGPVHSP